MELLVGPTFTIDVAPPPPVFVTSPSSPQDKHHHFAAANCLFLKDEEEKEENRIGPEDDSSDSSSSIGAPDDSEGEEEEENDGVVSSKAGLGSLDSLEESLPIKRGLSNYFSGKSKSFASLSDVTAVVSSVKDLEKPENPFNKRRRILMANKWSRKSFYSWRNPKSMPLLTLNEEAYLNTGDDDGDEREEHERDNPSYSSSSSSTSWSSSPSSEKQEQFREKQSPAMKLQERKFKTGFKSQSCFSLTDLQEEEYQ